MTLKQVVTELEKIALRQHNIRSVGHNDIYKDLSSNPSIKYMYFYINQNQHQRYGDFDRFSFNLFVIDRLNDVNGSNSLEVQSIAKSLLDNIIETFCTTYNASVYGTTYYQSFIQDFVDLTAGMYCTVTLEVPVDVVCPDY